MQITTKIFGEITIADDRIIRFPKGIVGFPELTDFTLIHDSEDGGNATIRWIQSLQEPAFAMPVMDPLSIVPDYAPEIADEVLASLGDGKPEDFLVLVTVTVPSDIKQMTINLKAPIVINSDNLKACQAIVENDSYLVKFPIYDILKANRKKAGV